MIEFKNNLRVRCLECKEEHFIEMKHVGSDKEQRSIGFEYEHIYRGELKCSHCGENMRLLTTIFEYPKEFLNYHETNEESCLVMDDIDDNSFIISDETLNISNETIKTPRKIKVYIASPYTLGDTAVNVKRQIDMFHVLRDHDFYPFAPLHSHFLHMSEPRGYEDWLEWDFVWLESCDCVLRLDGESSGADREVEHALKNNIPVFYSLEELYNYYKI